MYSTRQNKVSRLIQKELSSFFQLESAHLFNKKIITVTIVRVTPDLAFAKVYVSIFPQDKELKTLNSINAQVKVIRHNLGQKIRHQVKSIPELVFYNDDTLDYIEKIDTLLKK